MKEGYSCKLNCSEDVCSTYNDIIRDKICMQLAKLNISGLLYNSNRYTNKEVTINSCPVFSLEEQKMQELTLENLGLNDLKNDKLCILILAGGHGSRLGLPYSKGLINIGIRKELYIFELHINNIINKILQYRLPYIDIFIMTSQKTHVQITEFLANRDYFGYDRNHIYFFEQEECAVRNLNGQIFVDKDYNVISSPDGNGNGISTLLKKYPEKLRNKSWVNVVSIDNVLQNMADPLFLGSIIYHHAGCGAKVVKKRSFDEPVGTICLTDNIYNVIEYYEALQNIKNNSNLKFGVILNYIFSLDEFRKKNIQLTLHSVKREVTINGEVYTAYKDEYLLTDLIEYYDKCLVFEVERSKEFSPIKNKEGEDSIKSAQNALLQNDFEL